MTDTAHLRGSIDRSARAGEPAVGSGCRRPSEVDLGEQSGQPDARPSLEDIEEALKDVVDPELGINVVDLGLIYDLHLEDDDSLTIDMTLTSAACPLTDVIEDQTQTALEGLGRSVGDQLGVDAPVGHGDDHRRRSRPTARSGLQRLSAFRWVGSGRPG